MQNWMEAEKEAVTAENLARRSRRQKESVFTYTFLRRLTDYDHERILDGLYALGYTSDDMPKRYESGLGNSLRKEWDQLFNRNQVMNERSECFDPVFFLLLFQIQKKNRRLESDTAKTRRYSAENEGTPTRSNAQEKPVSQGERSQ